MRKAAEKYFVKNGELHIERKRLENEVKIINEKAAQKSVEEGKDLKMGIEFDWKKFETCESFQVIPKRKQEEVLKRYHGGESCHWGRDRMIAAMRRDGIYWFGQWEDCRKFIKRCEVCSRDDCKKTHEEPINSI